NREPNILAAHITGTLTPEEGLSLSTKNAKDGKADAATDKKSGEGEAGKADGAKADPADSLAGKEPEKTKIDVVLVSDIDWIVAPDIFRLRAMGDNPDLVVDFQFQNVPFALNILDSLANEKNFIDL